MEKRLSLPENILKGLVDLVAAGHYPNLSFGDINRALEMLKKAVKEETPEAEVQALRDKVKSLENELEVSENDRKGGENMIQALEREVKSLEDELEALKSANEDTEGAD